MMGSVVDAWTRATMSAESAIEVIIHEAPTDWMRPPKFDAKLANHTARKTLFRSGDKGEALKPEPS
jgi:hypothetical protein